MIAVIHTSEENNNNYLSRTDVAVQNTEARNKQLISKFKRYLLTAQAKQIIAK